LTIVQNISGLYKETNCTVVYTCTGCGPRYG